MAKVLPAISTFQKKIAITPKILKKCCGFTGGLWRF
jgi:hypothetical protein